MESLYTTLQLDNAKSHMLNYYAFDNESMQYTCFGLRESNSSTYYMGNIEVCEIFMDGAQPMTYAPCKAKSGLQSFMVPPRR